MIRSYFYKQYTIILLFLAISILLGNHLVKGFLRSFHPLYDYHYNSHSSTIDNDEKLSRFLTLRKPCLRIHNTVSDDSNEIGKVFDTKQASNNIMNEGNILKSDFNIKDYYLDYMNRKKEERIPVGGETNFTMGDVERMGWTAKDDPFKKSDFYSDSPIIEHRLRSLNKMQKMVKRKDDKIAEMLKAQDQWPDDPHFKLGEPLNMTWVEQIYFPSVGIYTNTSIQQFEEPFPDGFLFEPAKNPPFMHKERIQELTGLFRTHSNDTGSSEVQIARLTERIHYITECYKNNKQDKQTYVRLTHLAAKRRKLIRYLFKKDPLKACDLAIKLNIRFQMPLGWQTRYDKYNQFKNTFNKNAKEGRTLEGGTLSFLKEYKTNLEKSIETDKIIDALQKKREARRNKRRAEKNLPPLSDPYWQNW